MGIYHYIKLSVTVIYDNSHTLQYNCYISVETYKNSSSNNTSSSGTAVTTGTTITTAELKATEDCSLSGKEIKIATMKKLKL